MGCPVTHARRPWRRECRCVHMDDNAPRSKSCILHVGVVSTRRPYSDSFGRSTHTALLLDRQGTLGLKDCGSKLASSLRAGGVRSLHVWESYTGLTVRTQTIYGFFMYSSSPTLTRTVICSLTSGIIIHWEVQKHQIVAPW